MEKIVYERALVTGASSGIGAAICRMLTKEGLEVMAVARRADLLARLAEASGCRFLACDVTDHDDLTPVIEAFGPDVIVNNAGTGHGITGLTDIGVADIDESICINVLAPIKITAVAVAALRREGRPGHIVNMGSIAGLHTLTSALYGAGKSALHTFSQNLRVELRGTPIRVTEVCPGRTTSEFYGAARGDSDTLARLGKTDIHELQPEDIAAAVRFALNAPQHVNISTIEILPTEQSVGGIAMSPLGSGKV